MTKPIVKLKNKINCINPKCNGNVETRAEMGITEGFKGYYVDYLLFHKCSKCKLEWNTYNKDINFKDVVGLNKGEYVG